MFLKHFLLIKWDFWRFLKKPRLHRLNFSSYQKFVLTINFFVISLVILPFSFIASYYLWSIFPETVSSFKWWWYPTFTGFMFIMFLAPLWEELVFRYPMKKYSKYLLFFVFLAFFPILIQIYDLWNVILIYIIIFLLNYIFLSKPENLYKTEKIWNKNFWAVFYFFAIIFAVIHLVSYDFSWILVAFIPIILMMQIIVWIFMSYLRVSCGLKYAILLHVLYNSSIAMIIFLTN